MSSVKSIVLEWVWNQAGAHRQQIADSAGVNPALVSAAVRKLIAERWIVEGAAKKAPLGRAPVALRMDTDARAAVTLSYTPELLTCGLVNAAGDILCSRVVPHRLRAPSALLDLAARQVARICRPRSCEIIGLAVADPGMVDRERGVVILSSSFPGWHDVPMADLLRDKTGLPVTVMDVTHARAMAQYRLLPACRAYPEHVLYLDYYSRTIGFAFLTPVGIWRGNGFAGEVGHVVFGQRGDICRCGARGCLESRAGPGAVAARAKSLLDTNAHSTLGGLKHLRASDVFAAAQNGDRFANTTLREAIGELELCVAVITAMLHPGLIVIGAETEATMDILCDRLRKALGSRVASEIACKTQVVTGLTRENLSLTGAGLMLFDRIIRAGLERHIRR